MGLDVGDVRTEAYRSNVDTILSVATKSSHLKGTFIKALKDAAFSIHIAVEALKEHTSSVEVRKLQAENTQLRDLENLKC